jgi:hypothetical protein
MHANTHTTMALPTRRDRRAPARPDARQASCRPESRRPNACEPGGTHPRPACGRRCEATRPENAATEQPRRRHDQEPETAQPNTIARTAATTPTRIAPAASVSPANTAPAAATARQTNTAPATAIADSTSANKPWSPGSNRSRTPITAGPSYLTDERPSPVKRRPSPHPRPDDEWSAGRMRRTAKPSWGEKFAARLRGESGMSTAEYAVGTLAAVAFAGVLLKVLTSGPVQSALSDLIERALS